MRVKDSLSGFGTMVGRHGASGILIGAAVGTLVLVPAHGSAQDSLSVSCADIDFGSPLSDVLSCALREQAFAQHILGRWYDTGDYGLPEDDEEAVGWYRLAAEQGYASAQTNLGLMYVNGEGVPEDLVLAYMWYNLSAGQGNSYARWYKIIIEQRMTREQIAEAQRLSREWIETHPERGGN